MRLMALMTLPERAGFAWEKLSTVQKLYSKELSFFIVHTAFHDKCVRGQQDNKYWIFLLVFGPFSYKTRKRRVCVLSIEC